jgi:hypothetical protein
MANGRVSAGLEDGSVVSFETGDVHDDGWPMWGGSPGHNGAASPYASATRATPSEALKSQPSTV